jgi:hypothetical protein
MIADITVLNFFLQRLEGFIVNMRDSTERQQCHILTDTLLLIKEAWNTPVYGRDLAYRSVAKCSTHCL